MKSALAAFCIAQCAAVVILVAVLSQVGLISVAHVNLLWSPHPIALALNPRGLGIGVKKLQAATALIRNELKTQRSLVVRPRSAYISQDYPGAVKREDTDGWSTVYLRVGNVDTCLVEHFPETMKVLDSLDVNVHTIFFSELLPGKDIAPHCGQLRGLFRLLLILDGKKERDSTALATMGVYNDHDMCFSRFASQCPTNISAAKDGRPEIIEYNVGDVVVFNDFVCHWVENHAISPRLALVINVDRTDIASWRNKLTALGSWLFSKRKLRVFTEGSNQVCENLVSAKTEV